MATLCFRANGNVDLKAIPEWLAVEYSLAANEPYFYYIWVVPWIAEVAILLGTLQLDGTVESWIAYLERLSFEDIIQVSCFELFSPRADRDR